MSAVRVLVQVTSTAETECVAGRLLRRLMGEGTDDGGIVSISTSGSDDGRPPSSLAELAVPADALGTDLPSLVAVLLDGIAAEQDADVRLVDFDPPPAVADASPGPAFGVDGTRRLIGIDHRPLIGSIVKPSIGLTPAQTAARVRELAEAGADFVKDDELLASPSVCPFDERVRAVTAALDAAAARTGRLAMFAFNVTADTVNELLRRHEVVAAAGGTCVMVSVNHVGLAGFGRLRQEAAVPLHAHRNGWGALTRCPTAGLDFRAYRRIWGLAGADHLHVNGLASKFWEPDDSVVRSIAACLDPQTHGRILPVVSSGQWGGQAPETFAKTATTDLLYLAGGGMQGHPDGPAAGVAAVRRAWEAAVEGIPLEQAARSHVALRRSIEHFGPRARAT